jgi:hypothetical protein
VIIILRGTLHDTVYVKGPHCKKWKTILDQKLPVFQDNDCQSFKTLTANLSRHWLPIFQDTDCHSFKTLTANLSRHWLCHALRKIFHKFPDLFRISMSISVSKLLCEVRYTLDWRGKDGSKSWCMWASYALRLLQQLPCSRLWLVGYSVYRGSFKTCGPCMCTVLLYC